MLLDKLVKNLKLQIKTHQTVLEALKLETKLPANCSLVDLEEIQVLRDRSVKKIDLLEKERIEIINSYCLENNLDHPIDLKTIIECCDDDFKQILGNLRKQLKILMKNIAVVGNVNAQRASARIACFSEVQEAVHKAFKRPPTYSMRGVIRKQQSAYLVQKSV